MIINEINLNGIRSHKHSSIKFTDGINVITGSTGSGKSSILMAIEYTLFGKIDEGRGEGRLLLRRGVDDGTISVSLTEGDSNYTIIRGLKRVKDAVRNDDGKNMVIKDGSPLDLQNRATDINKYLLKLMKLESSDPIKTFEAITYIKQDELKDLIFESSQVKQQYIDQLLQLNKYADTHDRMKDIVNGISKDVEIGKKEESLIGDESELIKNESRLMDLEKMVSALRESVNKLMNEKKNNETERDGLNAEITIYKEKSYENEKLSAKVSEKRTEIAKLREQIESMKTHIKTLEGKAINVDEKTRLKLKEEISSGEKDIEKVRVTVESAYKEAYSAESYYERIKSDSIKMSDELTKLRKELDSAMASLKDSEVLIKEADKFVSEEEIAGRIRQLSSLLDEIRTERTKALESGVCVLCGSKIINKQHIEKEYSDKLDRYENELKNIKEGGVKTKLGKTRKEIEKEVTVCGAKVAELSAAIAKVEEASLKINLKEAEKIHYAKKTAHDAIKKELDELVHRINQQKQELSKIEEAENILREIEVSNAKISTLETSVSSLDKETLSLKGQIDELAFDPDDLKGREERLNVLLKDDSRISSELSKSTREIDLREEEIKETKRLLDDTKAKLRKKEELRIQINRKERLLSLVSNLREDIRNIREYVRNKFLNDFRALFQSKFLEIRNESDYTVDIDSNYNILVISSGESLDAKTLSGGEKTSVAIAYRMALSSVASMLGGVGKNELLIMDEPTSGLDKNDISSLADSILKIKDVNQIIIVTHEDSMKVIGNNIINITKSAGESNIHYA